MTEDERPHRLPAEGRLPGARHRPGHGEVPGAERESLTAVGILVRIFDGHTAGTDPKIMKGAELLLAQPPKWDPPFIDFYYWYYGTLAMYQVGGSRCDKWNEAMKTAIIAHQRHRQDRGRVRLVGSGRPVVGRRRAGLLHRAQLPLHGGLLSLPARLRREGRGAEDRRPPRQAAEVTDRVIHAARAIPGRAAPFVEGSE